MSRVATGTASAAIEYVVIAVGSIIAAPILLASLGLSRLGIFVLLMMLTPAGSLAIVDLGMEGALLARLAGAQASGAHGQRRSVLVRGVSFYAAVGSLSSVAVLALRLPVAKWLARNDPSLLIEVKGALYVLAVTIFIQFLAVPFAAHGLGAGSFANTKLWDAGFGGMHYAGVVGIATTTSKLNVLMLVPLCVAAARLATHGIRAAVLEMRSRVVVRERLHPGLVREASALFVNRLMGLVHNHIDQVLILRYLPPAYLAKYDLAYKPALLLRTSSSIASSTLTRESAYAHVAGGDPMAKRLILSTFRYLGVVLLPAFAVLEGQLDFLYRRWLGVPPSQVVATGRLFLIVMLFLPFGAITGMVMVGLRRVRETMWVPLLGLVANVVVSIVLIPHLGIPGVVVGTIVGQAISMAGYGLIVARMEGAIPQPERRTLVPVYPITVAAIVGHVLLRTALGVTWTSFLLAVALTLVHLVLMLRMCVTEAERSTLRSWSQRQLRVGSGR